MKKILSNIYLLAALFMIGAAITSCSKSDDTPTPEPKPVGPTTYTMTIKATKSADAKTRALSLDGSTLNATWDENDKVLVYQNGSKIGELTAAASSNRETTLSGDLDSAPSESQTLTFYFHTADAPSYDGQDGTLTTIASKYDFCAPAIVASGSFTVNDGNHTVSVPAGISFGANKQAIVKFTLIDKEAGTKLNPTIFAIDYDTGSFSLINIPSSTYSTQGGDGKGDGILYVAIPGFSEQKVTLKAIVGNNVYTYKKDDVSFSNGSYYAINVKMTKTGDGKYTGFYDPTPLTLECSPDATDGAAAVWVTDYTALYYKVDDGKWTPYTAPINQIDLTSGHKVSFRGDNSTSIYGGMTIHCSSFCYIYGNVMSLLWEDDYAWMTSLPYDNTFKELFYNNAYITHTYGKDLVLPATTLRYQCYSSMFSGCTHLTHIKCLATDTSAENCTSNWVTGTGSSVEGTKTFVVNSSLYYDQNNSTTTVVKVSQDGATVWRRSDSSIPSGWTVSDK